MQILPTDSAEMEDAKRAHASALDALRHADTIHAMDDALEMLRTAEARLGGLFLARDKVRRPEIYESHPSPANSEA
jgi:hypothetical protein